MRQLLHWRYAGCCFGLGLQHRLRGELCAQVRRRLETAGIQSSCGYNVAHNVADYDKDNDYDYDDRYDCYDDDHIHIVELGIILPLRR